VLKGLLGQFLPLNKWRRQGFPSSEARVRRNTPCEETVPFCSGGSSSDRKKRKVLSPSSRSRKENRPLLPQFLKESFEILLAVLPFFCRPDGGGKDPAPALVSIIGSFPFPFSQVGKEGKGPPPFPTDPTVSFQLLEARRVGPSVFLFFWQKEKASARCFFRDELEKAPFTSIPQWVSLVFIGEGL